MSTPQKPKHIRAARGRVARRVAMPPVVNLKSWAGPDQVPVAVLDVSEPDVLIEQVARAHAESLTAPGKDVVVMPGDYTAARITLESIGIISKRRAKK